MKCIGAFKILICSNPSLLWLYTRDGRKFCEKSYLMPWESKPDRLEASLIAILHVCSISIFSLNRSSSSENESPKVPVWCSSLVSYIWWINAVENWDYNLPILVLDFEDFHKFIQAPSGRSISFRENDNRNLWSFNCTRKWWRNFIFCFKFVIDESYNFFPAKAALRWLIKLWRISLPLKLRKTSYFVWGIILMDDEEEAIGHSWWLEILIRKFRMRKTLN